MTVLKCSSCGLRGVCKANADSWIFFFIGIVATVALRIIEPLNYLSPLYGKLSWYVGVTGFFIFFIYKYRVLSRRKKIIDESGLALKVARQEKLSPEEATLLSEIVCSQTSWKERANFFIIFALSAVALVFALYVDLLK